MLEDTVLADVTIVMDGQLFPVHRCVLAAQGLYFCAMFQQGKGMHEEGRSTAGKKIVIKDVSAGVFCVLLQFLYTHMLDFRKGLEVGRWCWRWTGSRWAN